MLYWNRLIGAIGSIAPTANANTYWTEYVSEENAPAICSYWNEGVTGFACTGPYCHNVASHCARLPLYEFRAPLSVPHHGPSAVSLEQPTRPLRPTSAFERARCAVGSLTIDIVSFLCTSSKRQ